MAAPASVRLFIALWPPDEVRAAIARWQAAWQWPEKAALVKTDRLQFSSRACVGDAERSKLISEAGAGCRVWTEAQPTATIIGTSGASERRERMKTSESDTAGL